MWKMLHIRNSVYKKKVIARDFTGDGCYCKSLYLWWMLCILRDCVGDECYKTRLLVMNAVIQDCVGDEHCNTRLCWWWMLQMKNIYRQYLLCNRFIENSVVYKECYRWDSVYINYVKEAVFVWRKLHMGQVFITRTSQMNTISAWRTIQRRLHQECNSIWLKNLRNKRSSNLNFCIQ